jgi:predicted RNase H-like HicB family nuclease
MAHGKTRVDAIKNAEDAIAFWIKTAKADGLPVPDSKGRLRYA